MKGVTILTATREPAATHEPAPWASFAQVHRLADLACAEAVGGIEPGRASRRKHFSELSPAEKAAELRKMQAGAAR